MTDRGTRGAPPPITDRDSDPWWAALQTGRLMLAHCRACGATWFPPTPGCPECGASDIELTESRGLGHVYSWVVVNRTLSPEFAGEIRNWGSVAIAVMLPETDR